MRRRDLLAGAASTLLAADDAQAGFWKGMLFSASGSAPVNTALPVVSSSSPIVGTAETTTNGSWTNSPTGYAYQWNWADTSTPISGATSSSYTPVSGDVGHTLSCTVTASNTFGSASATSSATGAVTIGWHEAYVGAGGYVSGASIADDGTLCVRCDTFGLGYIAKPGASTPFSILMQQAGVPSAFAGFNSQLAIGNAALPTGMWDVGIAPSNSNIICVAGAGATFVSTNKGSTWVQTPCPTQSDEYSNQNGYQSPYIVIDPQNPDICFRATLSNGVYRTSNLTSGASSTWTQVSTSQIPTSGTTRIVLGFDRSSAISGGATQGIYAGVSGHDVYHSTNGGTNWSATSCPLSTFRKIDVSRDGYVYAVDGATKTLAIYNGSSWSTVTLSGLNSLCDTVAADPNTTGRVVVVSDQGNYAVSTNHGGLWNTASGANVVLNGTVIPWLTISGGYISSGHAVFDPSISNTVYVTCGDGVFKLNPIDTISGSTAATYNVDSSQGIENLVSNDLCWGPGMSPACASDDRDFFKVGTNAYPSTYFPSSAGISFNTYGFFLDYAKDGSTTIIGEGWNWSTGNGPGVVTTDGGANWASWASQPFNGSAGAVVGGCVAASTATNWIAIKPDGSACYYTTNGGSSWTASTGLPTSGWSTVQCTIICADGVTAGTFYAYVANSGSGTFWRSTNNGASFSQMASSVPTAPAPYFARIRGVPSNAGHVWSSGGWNTGNPTNPNTLAKSTNGGASWTVPNSNVNIVLAFDFGAPKPSTSYPALFIAGVYNGVYGIFESNDAGVTYTQVTDSTFGGYPCGNYDLITCMCASKDTYKKLIIGFAGSGYWAFG